MGRSSFDKVDSTEDLRCFEATRTRWKGTDNDAKCKAKSERVFLIRNPRPYSVAASLETSGAPGGEGNSTFTSKHDEAHGPIQVAGTEQTFRRFLPATIDTTTRASWLIAPARLGPSLRYMHYPHVHRGKNTLGFNICIVDKKCR